MLERRPVHLALKILNIQQDDLVLCQDFTFVATINPVLYEKAVPILIDSEPDTLNMCPSALRKAIVENIAQGKKPKSVIAVHLYGMPAKIRQIKKICDEFEIPLVEDAAEALGSKVRDQYVGTFGDISIFSFNGNKIITTSSGGALVTDNSEWADRARYMASQSKENVPYYQHNDIGYNYAMSNLSAGIGCGQMEVLQERIDARRSIYARYEEAFAEVEGITFQQEYGFNLSNRWLSTIRFDCRFGDAFPFDLKKALDREGIEIRNMWKPMHLQPICSGLEKVSTKSRMLTEELFYSGICLPSGSALTKDEQEKVIDSIKKKVYGHHSEFSIPARHSVV
ncbi:DegT/DnrJ/EryC1/StrS family aminotransferase [Salimicrobium sp. PL1-032A]|uniref:DegT/DnrJ/EryC1/StrS family aminotransferase n=1 Tax=Salimicrobium sp. PL1-032A TaxID=3095364 RepID=UPI003260C9DB